MANTSVKFRINGKPYTVNALSSHVSPQSKLIDFIREHAKLKGTKYLCREGGCGACVVSVKKANPSTKEISTTSVNSCLTSVLSCDGWDISTIESLGNRKEGYHPIQKRLTEMCGTQCGFCTPGMVMSMHSMMEANGNLTVKDIEDALDGNICRCTGYRPILDAFKTFAVDAPSDLKQKCSDKSGCLECPCAIRSNTESIVAQKQNGNGTNVVIKFADSGKKWVKAVSLNDVYALVQKMTQDNVKYKLVAGNTGTGVFKEDESDIQIFVDIGSVSELHLGTYSSQNGIVVGGGLSIAEAIKTLQAASKFHQDFEYAAQIAKHFSERMGNTHIRNTATIAGNLALKRTHLGFASDVFLMFEAVAAQITIGCCSSQTNRSYLMTEFLTLDLTGKIIVSVILPPVSNDFLLRSYKISPRYQNSKGYINAAFLLRTAKAQNCKVVQKPTILFGGISSKFVHASKTENFLNGKSLLDDSVLKSALEILENELDPDESILNGSTKYRKSLAKSLLFKTILGVVGESSGGKSLQHGLRTGKQSYVKDKEKTILYKGFPKLEAVIQASGEAEYTDDIRSPQDELFGAFVLSTVANAKLKSIDPSAALSTEGVVAFIQAKDIPGKNNYMVWDKTPEEIFVSRNIQHAGQPLGLVVAENREIAFAGAKKVKVEYEDIQKPILTIQESLEKATREGKLEECTVSNTKSALDTKSEAKHTLKGRFQVGSQHHFQMEPHTCLCIPKEDGLDVYSATQWIDKTQAVISSALNIPVNNINVQVKRLGGGFGGKAARSNHVAAACAVAAYATNRAVKVTLDLETHMRMCGKRLPWDVRYEVNFDDTGKLTMLDLKTYCDPGFSPNEETTYLYMLNIQNCYEADGWTILAGRCLTNTPANTFCRAPGHTQGTATIEYIMEHVAFYLKKDPWEVRQVNFMKTGSPVLGSMGHDTTLLEENPLPKMIDEFKLENDYEKRMQAVVHYNQTNRWTKRGLALMPLRFQNHYIYGKYNVFISIYHEDGSVAISHGGIEMGQGINTKVAQVVAETLGIPLSKVIVKAANNLVSPNSSLTAAGTTSESCCFAASEASKILVDRIANVRKELADSPWEKIIKECHKRSIDLSASFMSQCYKDGLQGYDVWSLNMTEVEVDILTGEYKILRLDYSTDGTKSINPEVDLGQVEGALVFGLGLWTTEKLIYDPNTGQLLTNGTWDYKPPEPKDIPEDFRVTMFTESANKYGVLGSKSPGEASLCSSVCVLFALRYAINAARKDAGNTDWYQLDGPVTPEDVFRLCLTADSKLHVQ